MAIRVTSFSIQSNFPNDTSVYIANITSTIASATVESDVAISSVKFLFIDGQGASLVDATLSQGVWTATRANQIAYSNATVSIQVIDTDGGRFQGMARSYSVKAHEDPSLNYDIFRCDSNGDRDMDGGYVSLTVYASANPAELNPCIIGAKAYVTDGTTQTYVLGDSHTSVRFTSGVPQVFGNGAITADLALEATISVDDNADLYGGVTLTTLEPVTIPPVTRIINVKDEGTGIAFGKLCTEDERVQSAWQIDCDKGIHAMKTLYCDYESETVNRGNAVAVALVSNSGRFKKASFVEWSSDSSTGALLDKFEQYLLPDVDNDLASNKTYELLTTKAPVTIAQGGTGATDADDARINLGLKIAYSSVTNGGTTKYTIANNSRHFVLVIGSGVTNNYAVFMFACTSAGTATQRQISKGSGITVTTSGTTISITSSGAAATVMDWAISGDNLEVTT